ncbi:MAG TPA: hypothetical protein ENJ16_01870 [Planctomycetaceae bacterium]|nr:hypothetical protein [Planctomycetaceae bacterium]
MHANELVHLAALLTHYRETVIREADPSVPPALMDYWATAKARHCRWAEFLNGASCEDGRPTSPQTPHAMLGGDLAEESGARPYAVQACLEEILLSEPLTRVFAAVGAAIDNSFGMREWSPVTDSICQRQREFLGRAMQWLLASPTLPFAARAELDHLRRRIERWTDFLLAPWMRRVDVTLLAFDYDRVEDFAETLAAGHRLGEETYWTLSQASLHGAFRRTRFGLPFSARLNRQIAVSVLGCFPQSLFSLDEQSAPHWVPRLLRTAGQTERLLDSALRPTYRS